MFDYIVITLLGFSLGLNIQQALINCGRKQTIDALKDMLWSYHNAMVADCNKANPEIKQ